VDEMHTPGGQPLDSLAMDLEVHFCDSWFADAWIWSHQIDSFLKLQLERILEEHREGMVVRTGLRCHHDLCPILNCCWSSSDAGRRFLACPLVAEPCEFKYWVDKEFSGRARKVIEDLVSMRQSMTQLFMNSSEQWDAMYADRQRTRRENRELKSIIVEQRSCIMLLLCFCIVIGGGLWLIL
jgi:hypothetical protein